MFWHAYILCKGAEIHPTEIAVHFIARLKARGLVTDGFHDTRHVCAQNGYIGLCESQKDSHERWLGTDDPQLPVIRRRSVHTNQYLIITRSGIRNLSELQIINIAITSEEDGLHSLFAVCHCSYSETQLNSGRRRDSR